MTGDTKDTPEQEQKKKVTPVQPFKSPSRFSGGGGASGGLNFKSQYKPTPIRITQHKG